MTKRQKVKVEALIGRFGRGPVQAYVRYFYPGVEIENLSAMQAHKLITGFGTVLPKPLFGFVKG